MACHVFTHEISDWNKYLLHKVFQCVRFKPHLSNLTNVEYLTRNFRRSVRSHCHNILRLLMFYQIFFLSQVKRCAIITYKYCIYELLQELLNDLRLRVLGNYKILQKSKKWGSAEPITQTSF